MNLLYIPRKASRIGSGTRMLGKKVLGGILDHYTYTRIGNEKMPRTKKLGTKKLGTKVMNQAIEHGTGHDMLRCLAIATHNFPCDPKNWDLYSAAKLVTHDVDLACVGFASRLETPRMEDAPGRILY